MSSTWWPNPRRRMLLMRRGEQCGESAHLCHYHTHSGSHCWRLGFHFCISLWSLGRCREQVIHRKLLEARVTADADVSRPGNRGGIRCLWVGTNEVSPQVFMGLIWHMRGCYYQFETAKFQTGVWDAARAADEYPAVYYCLMCFKAHLKVGINTVSKRNNSFRAKLLAITSTTFDESLIIKNQGFFCLWTSGYLRSHVIHGKGLILISYFWC